MNDRVVAIEEKIAELNRRVAETCFTFEDVVAYVDANIADGEMNAHYINNQSD